MSFLRSALFVARKDLWYLLRQKETLLWTFAMPPVFFFFIGTVTGGMRGGMDEKPALDFVAPEPAGFLADGLAERLEAEGFDVRRAAAPPADSVAAPRRLVLAAGFTDSLTAGRRVPARLEREGELDPTAQRDQIRVARAVYGLLADAALVASAGDSVTAAALAREQARPRLFTLEVRAAGEAAEPPMGFQQAVPGTMVMFTLLVLLTSGAVLLVIERRDGLLRRVASTPLPRAGVVAGKWASRMALALVQIGFAMAIGTLLFRVDWDPISGWSSRSCSRGRPYARVSGSYPGTSPAPRVRRSASACSPPTCWPRSEVAGGRSRSPRAGRSRSPWRFRPDGR